MKTAFRSAVALLTAFGAAYAQSPSSRESNKARFPCRVVRVIDGDTFVADIYFPLDITLRNQRIRVLGIDSPEIRGPEKLKGEKSKIYTLQALRGHVRLGIEGRDSFGRVLADVYVYKNGQWRSLAKMLLESGNAKPWQKGRSEKRKGGRFGAARKPRG